MKNSGISRIAALEQVAQTMPFDQFGRYHMLREAVDACRAKLGLETLSILDVGGLYRNQEGKPTLPIKQFLPNDEIIVLDLAECALPGYVKGDGTALEFHDAQFDLVVSSDTLEHIPPGRRNLFGRELLRVARHGVILLAPFFTPSVQIAERLLFEYIKTELSVEQIELKEHSDNGLPVLAEWLTFLQEMQIKAHAYPTGYLHAWLAMMMLKHALPSLESQRLAEWYYNQCFFPTERRNPAYRYLVIAEKTEGLVEAVDAILGQTLMPDREDASADWMEVFIPALLAIIQHQVGGIHRQDRIVLESLKATNSNLGNVHEILGTTQARLGESLNAIHSHLGALIKGQNEQIEQYRQQVSLSERIIADQQMTINRLQDQQYHLDKLVGQQQAIIQDLTERSKWFEDQNSALRRHLEAVQNGLVMRLLNLLARSK